MKNIKKIIFPLLGCLILASCDQDPKFTFNGTNCTCDCQLSYKKGSNLTLTITADASYVLTDDISVKFNNVDAKKGTDYTYTLSDDSKTGSLKFVINSNVTVTASAVDEQEMYKVSETEFNNAVKFEGIDYFQYYDENVMMGKTTMKISPNIHYGLMDATSGIISLYQEMYVEKTSSGEYKIYSRNDSTSNYIEGTTDENTFNQGKTMIIGALESKGLTYSSFVYNDQDHFYSASIDDGSGNITLYSFKFKNKKLSSYLTKVNGVQASTCSIEYNEEEIPLPTNIE